ncbi:MAG: DNA repair protein RecN [Bacteroidales bacterium]|nr:DNA repair protein RecN [Bacteroidales bacterium]
MLQTLSIENYALIEKLNITFPDGLSIITGETGAGKSILLGALSLILGQRADTMALKDKNNNCIVEACFAVDGYGLEEFFLTNDIDYDNTATIRRIISPTGKSRAFINEIPVNLNLLKELGDRLLDIHSQHQNLLVGSLSFQTSVVDAQANHANLLTTYKQAFTAYKESAAALSEWQDKAHRAKAEYDYLLFQYNELNAIQLKAGEQQILEEELKQLTHAEEIKEALIKANTALSSEDISIDNLLREALHGLQKISPLLPQAQGLTERLNSSRIELRDINQEIDNLNNKIDLSPDRLSVVESRLNAIYSLQQKHHLNSVEALINLYEELREKLNAIENFDQTLDHLQKQHDLHFQAANSLAEKISEQRKKTVPDIEKNMVDSLQHLGMPHVVFRIVIDDTEQLQVNGKNTVTFLFSANKEIAPQELSRIASGGEISRVMLCLKSLMARNSGLSTIIFDEIDAGVSGDIADKMGNIVYDLSKTIQVINITHLPQVASKGKAHFVVFKHENAAGVTTTAIKALNPDERLMEIAKMLSGQSITQAAIDNAKELLNSDLLTKTI